MAGSTFHISPDQPLGDLVASHPSLTEFCLQQELDFCCGGDRTVAQHCAALELPQKKTISAMETMVEQSTGRHEIPTFDQSQMPELIDFILERFHAGHRRQMQTIRALLAKVLANHEERFAWLPSLASKIETLFDDLSPHMRREENILFPALRGNQEQETPDGCAVLDPSMPIQVMRADHQLAGQYLLAMERLTNGFQPPKGVCDAFRALYRELAAFAREVRLHIHLENNVLFPMALSNQP